MLAITIYRPIDDAQDGEYLTYFTNINWILLTAYFGVPFLLFSSIFSGIPNRSLSSWHSLWCYTPLPSTP
jgi:hypothetical protein